MLNKKILSSALIVTIAAAAFVSGTTAYFSDTETSADNVLQAGAIDLMIDNHSYYNGAFWPETSWGMADLDDGAGPADGKYLFFNFDDLKPGDWGEDTISAHITNNDSWLCMDVEVTETPENGQTEPESKVDTTVGDNEGELQDFVKFVFWADDGDNVLEVGENVFANNVALSDIGTVALSDSTQNIWGEIGPLTGSNDLSQAYYVGKAWCFGDLTLAPVVQDEAVPADPLENPGILCNGANVDNSSQTDAVFADVSFTAVQSRHNGDYRCVGCEESGTGYADKVVYAEQGTLQDGVSPVSDPLRTDPTEALYAPGGDFYSLGFGGELILKLQGPVEGDSIVTLEVTNGRGSYPVEKARVYVAENSTGPWVDVGVASNIDNGTGISEFAIGGTGLSQIEYVRLVDESDISLFDGKPNADGYDLDAVTAVVCLDEDKPAVAVDVEWSEEI